MFIFGKVFTTTQAAWVIALFAVAVLEFLWIIWHIVRHIRKEKRKNQIIYLYQNHYEVRRK